jgi:hypothetical protein
VRDRHHGSCRVITGDNRVPRLTVSSRHTRLTWDVYADEGIVGIAIAASPDGSKVFVTGITTAKSGTGEIGTAAYDATTGALLWIGSYSPLGFSGIGRSITVSPDESKVFTTGAIWPGTDNNNPNTMVTAAYNS